MMSSILPTNQERDLVFLTFHTNCTICEYTVAQGIQMFNLSTLGQTQTYSIEYKKQTKVQLIVLVFVKSLCLYTSTMFFFFFYQRCIISKITFRDFKQTYRALLFSFPLKRPSRVLQPSSPEHINIVISGVLLWRSQLQERYTYHAPRHMKAFHTIKYMGLKTVSETGVLHNICRSDHRD